MANARADTETVDKFDIKMAYLAFLSLCLVHSEHACKISRHLQELAAVACKVAVPLQLAHSAESLHDMPAMLDDLNVAAADIILLFAALNYFLTFHQLL